MALGLDRAIDKIAQNNDSGCENLVGDIVPLEEFNYTNEKLGCILQESLAETQFTGITVSYYYSCHNNMRIVF